VGSGIYVSLSGAVAQQAAMDVTANNVANASTTGFRAERVSFGAVLGRAAGGPDRTFVQVGTTKDDFTAGNIRETGNPLDLALAGDGFFAVNTPRGPRYTRAGDFRLDGDGRLVNSAGLAARARGGGQLVIPKEASDVVVGADGTVTADGAEIGALELARFAPGILTREGANLYVAPAGALTTAGPLPEVVSGAVEQANFNVVRGVVDLVKISRAYDALHRMIESYKRIDDRSAREIGGPK
jgi:flagellar basal-body rod protein FlgF